MTSVDERLDRMFRVLVRTIRTRHPTLLTESFTVGDLQQTVLPYRHFRRDLGLESNVEYEYTLMQLLAGVHDYVEAEDRVHDELTRELAKDAPEPSRIREFADARIWLNQAAAAEVRAAGTPVSSPAQAPSPGATAAQRGDAEPVPSSARCRFCGGELPKLGSREISFCPHCGQNLRIRHCPACGAEAEAEWKHCVSCGKSLG